jgi:adenylate cyclase
VDYDDGWITIDGTRLPIDDEGAVVMRFSTPGDPNDPEALPLHTFYTAWDVLQSALAVLEGVDPVIDPADLEGKYVLFGLQAAGLLDLRPTPLDPRAPGVTVHATMLDNLLAGEVMRDSPTWATVVALVLLTVAGAMGATYASRTWVEALLIVGFLAGSLGLGLGSYLLGLWVPMVAVLIAVFVALAASNVANYATEGAARRQIRGMFGRYLSPDVISELEQDPEALELGGKEADITIYFSDIQKFSTISTKLDPQALVEFLNVYLTPMTNAILEEGGLIDKYEGDAIIALWGAPKERTDHAEAGLRSMLKCQAALNGLRPMLKEQIGTEVYQRIGMSSGKATVGNMGSELRRDYTMIGDAVNLAARLEGANKAFGTYSMVSEDTIKAAGGLERVRRDVCQLRELGFIAVVGREDKPVRVYEPLQPDEYETRSGALSAYQQAIELFQAGEFGEARPIFERLAEADPAAASYLPRCDELMKSKPADWNGVWVLTEKG